MNILIACEYSGLVRDAFIKKGHNAVSCDILPTERPGPHYTGDVRDMLEKKWDMIIAFPPCTYLANSGVCWLYNRDEEKTLNLERWANLDEGAAFFKLFLDVECDKVVIENPIPHGYAVERIGKKYTQIIQPWQFGHGETKATCLWLKGVPKLTPTNIVEGREQRIHNMSPGPNRQKERSKTFEGIAKAMADQWG